MIGVGCDQFASSANVAASPAILKLADFDFAGYAFGLVAVAVSFSAAYISIVPESCIGQLKKCVEVHLIPAPFGDWREVRDRCHPNKETSGLKRSARVKTLYVLAIWGTIGRAMREEQLGPDGIDETEPWLNKRFELFENQTDRLLAVTLGAAISVIYLAVPLTFPFVPVHVGFAMLATLYVLCLADVLACAFMFYQRYDFVRRFDDAARSWVEGCETYLANLAQASITSI